MILANRRQTFDVAHVSSAHRWTDNRVHMREAASTARRYRTLLIAVDSPTDVPDTGVHVIRLPRRPRLRRILLNSPRAVWLAVRSGAPVAHLHDPELVWAIPILRALGRRVVFDAHEDIPDQMRDKDYLPTLLREPLARLAGAVVWLAARSDHVIAATSITASRYPVEKTSVVHNFPRLRDAENQQSDLLERPRRAAYIGVVSELRGSRVMVRAAAHEAFPDGWELDVAGPIHPEAHRVELEREATTTTAVHGLLSPEAARDILLTSRVGLVVLHPTHAYQRALATKMFEYLAAGIPVIASDFPVWREILSGYECAQFVDPHDPGATARAVAFYNDNPGILVEHGRTARRAALERFNWTKEEPALFSVYENLGLEPRS